MKVIAAIPTYNGAAYLKRLLPELKKQNFYKIYVIDDCSTDGSRELYKEHPQVSVIYGKKNVGPVANRNRILKEDLGDIVFFLDDDMELLTNKIPENLTKLFSAHPDLGVLGASVFNANDKLLNFNFDRQSNPLFQWMLRLKKRR